MGPLLLVKASLTALDFMADNTSSVQMHRSQEEARASLSSKALAAEATSPAPDEFLCVEQADKTSIQGWITK